MTAWTKWIKYLPSALLTFWLSSSMAADSFATNQQNDVIEIQSVTVKGRSISLADRDKVSLGPYPEQVCFNFGQMPGSNPVPVRIRYKLEGYDNKWNCDDGEMNLAVRFYNDSKELIYQKMFIVTGESAGWTGSLKTSSLTHRRGNSHCSTTGDPTNDRNFLGRATRHAWHLCHGQFGRIQDHRGFLAGDLASVSIRSSVVCRNHQSGSRWVDA